MHTSQFSIHDLKFFLRRRKKYIILPPIIVLLICIVGAKMLPKQYESSTTIWVQPDEILNPLVSYQMAVQLAAGDRLETLMEVVYSRKTIETVIDSVGLGKGIAPGVGLDDLVDDVRANIKTGRKGADSFTISYLDTDPVRAQRMVSVLARTFIETRIRGEARRNSQTVEFFERKLKDYQAKFEITQREMVSTLLQRIRERPAGTGGLSVHLEDLDRQIHRSEEKILGGQNALAQLAMFPEEFSSDKGRQALGDLRHSELPYADELRSSSQQYDDASARYTPLHPEVAKSENRVLEAIQKMRSAVETEQAALSSQVVELRANRQRSIEELMKTSVDQQQDVGSKSNYNLYQKLYEDMKTKLEQAKITQDLGKTAEDSFIILDPARVPTRPSKPNQALIIAGGGIFGIILGIAAALGAEFLDTRMRSLGDLQRYNVPVIALLPEIGTER